MDQLKSILVIKLSSVGDIVMATAAVHHLKQTTGARITWAVDEGMAPLLEGHPDVDELLLFPRDPFRPPSPSVWAKALPKLAHMVRQLRRRSFDLAIDFQGRGRSYLLLKAARARVKIGRGRFPFLTNTVPHRRDVSRHAVLACFEPLERIGLQRPQCPSPVLASSAEDMDRVIRILQTRRVAGRFICLIPGTTWQSKQWPMRHWAELAEWLIQSGFKVVLVGSRREEALGQAIRPLVSRQEELFSFFGAFSLRELRPLFELSDAVIACDTGPLHIATTTKAPLIALFGPTDPGRTGPWPAGTGVILTAPSCLSCRLPRCRRECMRRILPTHVIAAVGRLGLTRLQDAAQESSVLGGKRR